MMRAGAIDVQDVGLSRKELRWDQYRWQRAGELVEIEERNEGEEMQLLDMLPYISQTVGGV